MPLRISEEEEKDDDDDDEEEADSDDEHLLHSAPRCMIPQVVSFAWSTRVCSRHESTVTSTVPCAPRPRASRKAWAWDSWASSRWCSGAPSDGLRRVAAYMEPSPLPCLPCSLVAVLGPTRH